MSVLIKPIITEKMTADSELFNRYGFYVNPNANKLEIKDAVEATYGVSVRESKNHELWSFKKNTLHQEWYSAW